MNLLSVVSIENAVASNGRNFNKVGFTPLVEINGKKVISRTVRYRNIWDASVDGSIKADGFYGKLKVGDVVQGKIVTVDTTTYEINNRQVNAWTGIVFDDEKEINYINSQLKQNEAVVVIDGVLTAEIPTKKQIVAVNGAMSLSDASLDMPF